MEKVLQEFNEFLAERNLTVGALHQIKDNSKLVHQSVFANTGEMSEEDRAEAVKEAVAFLEEKKLKVAVMHSYTLEEIEESK